jgi:hypothetical protein
MRSFLLLTLTSVLMTISHVAFAARPVYDVREYPDVVITGINARTRAISFPTPDGGSQALRLGPKTWIIRDNEEATFRDLQIGQHIHVWFIPRGAQAVVVEVLSP